ncbi:MAG: hypothetical protein R3E68_15085 [Burkholderiaceae bacterium]
MSFTDVRIGRPSVFVGAGELPLAVRGPIFWLSVFNTVLYTTVASLLKSSRSACTPGAAAEPAHAVQGDDPRDHPDSHFIVPTVLSAIAFWWIYDPQFSIVSWMMIKMEPDLPRTSTSLGDVEPLPLVGDLRQHLARRPLRGHHVAL